MMQKKYKVKIEAKAQNELKEIYLYIAKSHPTNARKFIALLKEKMRSLSSFPERGVKRPDLSDSPSQDRRFISFRNYSIIYQINESEIKILQIVGPGQDWFPYPTLH